MSWLRIDDGFPFHPKLVGISREKRWTWLEILAYCARFRTEGNVPKNIREVVQTATPALLKTFVAARLLEETEEGWKVHDWGDYNGPEPLTNAERQRRFRNASRNAGRNGAIGESNEKSNGPSRTRASARGPSRPFVSKETPPYPHVSEDVYRVALSWLDSPAFDPDTMGDDAVRDELGVIERRMRTELTPALHQMLLEHARSKAAK